MLLTMRSVPWSLVLLRLVLAPSTVLLAWAQVNGWLLALTVLIALLSDIYDGVLARKLGCDTPAIRLADSLVDTVFYLGVLWALWMRVPRTVQMYWPLLATLLVFELARHIFDLIKFGKSASYHSYLAKLWGLVMAISVMGVFMWSQAQVMIAVSLVLGIFSNMEGLLMSLILPVWRNDVKTLGRALAIRRSIPNEAD